MTEEIDSNVELLASKGVAYVTLAHLIYRVVATNEPALPFMPDWLYRKIFKQPAASSDPEDPGGLSDIGRAAVEAMAKHRMMVDVSHMREDAIDETIDLLEELESDVPVIASHAGYRFGGQNYMLSEAAVKRIKEQDGVLGIIMAQHQLNDGVGSRTRHLSDSIEVICQHIDRISQITGGYRHVAFGTDFDGFVKPTMSGLEGSADMPKLEGALRARYGKKAAQAISSGNAIRVMRRLWPA